MVQGVVSGETFGFPPGYFTIRSLASNRVLDVAGDSIEDGSELTLWPEKERSLVESMRNPDANNQVFFIDTSGALCSRSSGHALDVEGDRIVLRHRRPVSYPYPNEYAHPLPNFAYSEDTGEITVTFSSDPSYPLPDAPQSHTWKYKTYVLVYIPTRKPKSLLDNASQVLSSAVTTPISFLTGRSPPRRAKPEEVFGAEFDLAEDEILEEDKGIENEADDSPEPGRAIRVLGIVDKENSDKLLTYEARNRRRWEVSGLRTTNAKSLA
ncbi:hypothetical protein BDN72DRAFT_830651 [Pluteus cervinus]|uniref:Uncharacterized protein n=1 Tax=Pluteus cervinus TaxID=181527 RepID=A0ACD3BHF8_9AGAR|nr:hypothetical protein BDN72DRAFT_830651 [Pluteus cervinus]